jgi:hypothetical protein
MIATFSRRASLFFVLYCLAARPNVLMAADSFGLGEILKEIKEIAFRGIDEYKEWHKEKIKNSVSVLSARMSRIAGLKRSLAGFLDGKPATFAQFAVEDHVKADELLQTITIEIADLQDDLRAIDSHWAEKNPELHSKLTTIGTDKELKWPFRGPHSANPDVKAFQQWLIDEAKMLEEAASEIKSKLPA